MAIRKHKTADGRTSYFVYLSDRDDRKVYVGKARTLVDAKALERREKDRLWQISKGLALPEPKETFAELAEDWVGKRVETHRGGKNDRWRLRRHVLPFFCKMRLNEIGVAQLKEFLDAKRRAGAGKTTLLQSIRLIGRFLNEQVAEGKLASNPVAKLDRATRRLFRPDHDPRKTPYLRRKEDIANVYRHLPTWCQPMFAVGVFAGLRTGEILGLRIEDIDLGSRRILVHRSFDQLTKDAEPRIVPINDTLLPILHQHIMKSGHRDGLVFRPTGHGDFVKQDRLRDELRPALEKLGLRPLTWYQATRHTFASHWVSDGRSIQKLRDILGHSTVKVTERYAHLAPDVFVREDYAAVSVDLSEPKVIELGANGSRDKQLPFRNNGGTTDEEGPKSVSK